jgi:hypothetical protein
MATHGGIDYAVGGFLGANICSEKKQESRKAESKFHAALRILARTASAMTSTSRSNPEKRLSQ